MEKKRVKALIAGLEAQGATIREKTNGWQILCPSGGIVTIHGTPSDRRAEMNLKSEIRRRGLRWPL